MAFGDFIQIPFPSRRKTIKNKTAKIARKFHPLAFHIGISCGIVFLYFFNRSVAWFKSTFDVGIEQIAYTIQSPLKGSNIEFFATLSDFVSAGTVAILVASYAAFAILYEFIFSKNRTRLSVSVRNKSFSIDVYRALRIVIRLLIFVLFVVQTFDACVALQLGKYIASRREKSTLYENFYRAPKGEGVKGDGKNLIYIYLESMEVTYASEAEGGHQAEKNYIPHLTVLAHDNVNFSAGEGLGGFRVTKGSTWTMGAIFSTSSGIPFAFPIEANKSDLYEAVGKKVVALGDILEEKGYAQEFLCGSNGNFAGRKQFFEQHGNFKVFDLFSARDAGYVDDDYYVWWGLEDEILYNIACDELTRLAAQNEKFNFTMLTADTHHVGGYICKKCGNEFPTPLENVIACADRQLYEFVAWISKQDFFDDTLIVVSGDHRRMDKLLVEGIDNADRFIYNCFINANAQEGFVAKGREFTSLDIFPTVLSAMGFELSDNRMGLGTNLFSGEKTLSEELGFSRLNEELSKRSTFYEKNFY